MNRVEVLDHGYVELCGVWGSDEDIIRAARQSTQKGFLGWGPVCPGCGDYERGYDLDHVSCIVCGSKEARKPGDEKLLRYLWENDHSTPFEFAGATFEVQAPIFVFREWHRHRVPFGYSEASARYAPLPDVNYVPTIDRILTFSKKNKQASPIAKSEQIDRGMAILAQRSIERVYQLAQKEYEAMLGSGVAKEVARVVLPVGRYSCMRATGNLRGWLGFLTLREAPSAQWEIRKYANAVHGMLRERFPRTMALYEETAR